LLNDHNLLCLLRLAKNRRNVEAGLQNEKVLRRCFLCRSRLFTDTTMIKLSEVVNDNNNNTQLVKHHKSILMFGGSEMANRHAANHSSMKRLLANRRVGEQSVAKRCVGELSISAKRHVGESQWRRTVGVETPWRRIVHNPFQPFNGYIYRKLH